MRHVQTIRADCRGQRRVDCAPLAERPDEGGPGGAGRRTIHQQHRLAMFRGGGAGQPGRHRAGAVFRRACQNLQNAGAVLGFQGADGVEQADELGRALAGRHRMNSGPAPSAGVRGGRLARSSAWKTLLMPSCSVSVIGTALVHRPICRSDSLSELRPSRNLCSGIPPVREGGEGSKARPLPWTRKGQWPP